ncbi:hypothetical protein HTG_13530 [Natrinema mahii]|nr:hypothetical protein HTG_13530 [Natrinema mahii]
MSQNYTLSEFQVIFGQHDDGFLTRGGTHLRVNRVTGCSTLRHHPMTEVVAEAIDEAERANRDHTDRKNARFAEKYASDANSGGSDNEEDGGDSSASEALDQMLGGDEEGNKESDENLFEPQTDGGSATGDSWIVPPSQVKLLELTDDSRVEAMVYPRSFRCPRCSHFEFLDPTTNDLTCPDCSSTLRQYPLVYACPRCANVDQMQPRDTNVGRDHVGVIRCEDCDTGHYHLHHEGSLSTAQFECTSCDSVQTVRRFCRECHIPSNEDGEDGAPSVMKPTPTDASSLVSPMVKSSLFINDNHISLETLREAHKQGHDPYRWNEETLPQQEQTLLSDFWGLNGLFNVDEVSSLTAVYGYQTRVTAEGTDIDDDERLTRTFEHGDDMKRAYVTRSEGRGLVFDLDIETLYEAVRDIESANDADSYGELAKNELEELNESPVKNLVDSEHELVLIPLLHALEHALFSAAAHEIGMDDILGSKLLIKDGAIILYEREDVGAGGLAQLTLDQGGRTLKKFLRKAAENLSSCGQFCETGCPSCIYTDDFECRPYLPTEVNRWVPPNALLNRDYAHQFINAN